MKAAVSGGGWQEGIALPAINRSRLNIPPIPCKVDPRGRRGGLGLPVAMGITDQGVKWYYQRTTESCESHGVPAEAGKNKTRSWAEFSRGRH